jgi:M6 family metalloprotease-like protein
MKKLLLSLLMTALLGIQAFAEPAHNIPVMMPQPDGSLVTVCLVGDEFYHFNTTADGYTIMLNEAGAYVYAQRDGMKLVPTEVLAHDAGMRSAAELALLENTPKRLTDEVEVAQSHVRRAKRNVSPANFDFSTFRGCVILIDFRDFQFMAENPQEFYTEMFSKENLTGFHDPFRNQDVTCPGSVRDYFSNQSDGVFAPPFDVYGPYRATYGSNNTEARANLCQGLSSTIFTNALKAADADIDFTRYDNNNDGKIDMVYFLVAGYASSYSGNNAGYLWPHASNLSGRFYDGKGMDRYASSTELYGPEANPSYVAVEGIGTVCHEFSHVLGLPDFYDTDYEKSGGESHHPGGWDLMAGGGDYNYGRSPVGYTFFERYALGWAEAETIKRPGSYRLSPVNTAREGYILCTPVRNEFFTLENRQRTGWDTYLPGHGMIVTRVDSTNVSMWTQNKLNVNPDHNYFEMLRAGNSTSGDSSSDPFPGTTGNMMLTNDTYPNLATWAGNANEYIISGISEKDGIITFNVLEDGTLQTLVEDFENMPVSTGTADKNVEGNFATWSFSKSGVRAPGEDKANGENSVMMKLPSLFYSTTPVYYNTYMASLTVFNTTTSTAKYSLEYSVENDADGNPIWMTAMSSKGTDMAEVADKTTGICYWMLDLKNTQPALFRIYERSGHKNNATYVDDFTLYYLGEEGGPIVIIPGDVNGDGEVNIADINAVLDIIMTGSDNEDLLKRADVNTDSEINIADVNMIIDIILK